MPEVGVVTTASASTYQEALSVSVTLAIPPHLTITARVSREGCRGEGKEISLGKESITASIN